MKKNIKYYIQKAQEECLYAFLYPFAIFALSYIRYRYGDPVNIYLFLFLFLLSIFFAVCTRGGALIEKENKNNQEKIYGQDV